jgi:hypothetical protein
VQRIYRLPEFEERCAAREPCHDKEMCFRWRANKIIGIALADHSIDRTPEKCDHFLKMPFDEKAP